MTRCGSKELNPFQPSVASHIETRHLFYRAKQMTGFYMKCNTGLKWGKMVSNEQYFSIAAMFKFFHISNLIWNQINWNLKKELLK